MVLRSSSGLSSFLGLPGPPWPYERLPPLPGIFCLYDCVFLAFATEGWQGLPPLKQYYHNSAVFVTANSLHLRHLRRLIGLPDDLESLKRLLAWSAPRQGAIAHADEGRGVNAVDMAPVPISDFPLYVDFFVT
jgi:hypothetical protein